MALREDVGYILTRLRRHRVSISTRNCKYALDAFLDHMNSAHFHPCIHRDSFSGINKPDPRVALNIMKMWNYDNKDGTHSLTHTYSLTRTHSFTHSPIHSLTYSLTHSLTYLLTHSPTHSLTHSLTYSLTHSLTRPGDVYFVGDSSDDIYCGKGANIKTCLITTSYNKEKGIPADFVVDTLSEFIHQVL